jgi:protein-disulfide isomerase
MPASVRATALLALFTIAGVLACTNGQDSTRPQPPPATAASAPTSAPIEAAPRAPVAATALDSFPAVSLDGLGPAEKAAFAMIVNEEICPCDCPKSFGACLQADSKCRPAVILAEWLAGQLAEGVGPEILAEQIAGEVSGFSSAPKSPKLEGYAKKGAATGKHVVVEYADFECAHCKMAVPVVDDLARSLAGSVTFYFKHFPLSFHVMAKPAAEACEAAGMQGKFWEMHDAVFATQSMLDDELLKGHAKAIGLDYARWEKDRATEAVKERVNASRLEGETFGIEATPTFFVNGRPFNLMRTPDAFQARFAMEDARGAASCR